MDDTKPNIADNHVKIEHHHVSHGQHRNSGGGREDCWSEGATGTLIHAWGDRYLQLSRGNLRQKDWKDVADAVNARQDALDKPRKTDVQCKNRIDTIKKKYKVERSKPGPSKWPFYAHLEELIGPGVVAGSAGANNHTAPITNPKPSPSPAVTFTVKKLNPIPNPNGLYSGGSSSKSRLNSPGSTGSSHDSGDRDPDHHGGGFGKRKQGAVKDSVDGMAFRELAQAILKFGEVYERIESSKQQQIMELERQRMEFTKDLEFQRMKMFMEAQLQLEKTKRPKYSSGAGKKL